MVRLPGQNINPEVNKRNNNCNDLSFSFKFKSSYSKKPLKYIGSLKLAGLAWVLQDNSKTMVSISHTYKDMRIHINICIHIHTYK